MTCTDWDWRNWEEHTLWLRRRVSFLENHQMETQHDTLCIHSLLCKALLLITMPSCIFELKFIYEGSTSIPWYQCECQCVTCGSWLSRSIMGVPWIKIRSSGSRRLLPMKKFHQLPELLNLNISVAFSSCPLLLLAFCDLPWSLPSLRAQFWQIYKGQ